MIVGLSISHASLAVICHRLYQPLSHVILLQPNIAASEKLKPKVLALLLTWRISWLRASKHFMVAPRSNLQRSLFTDSVDLKVRSKELQKLKLLQFKMPSKSSQGNT